MSLFIRQIHTSVVRVGVKNHYQVLGVSKDASSKEIRAAFIRLSKELHPDVNKLTLKQSNGSFVDVNEAYSVLSNPVTRREYDMRQGQGLLIHRYPASHAYSSGPHFYGPQLNTYYYNESRRSSNTTVVGLLCLFFVLGGVLQFFRISEFMKTKRAAAERSRQRKKNT